MNHQYIERALSDDKQHFDITPRCSICDRYEIDHTDNAECEGCASVGICELVGDMLLCANCAKHDKDLAELNNPNTSERSSRVTQLINRLAKEIPLDRRKYFVGRITSIVDIEQELKDSGLSVEETRYKLAQIVESNLILLKQRLTAKHEEIRELQGESVADQKYLNTLVPQLRAEEREKFKQYDINYQPSAVVKPASAVAKPRMSASDKAIASMAKLLGISPEQARIAMEGSVKNVMSVKCTCSETPGICRVHVS